MLKTNVSTQVVSGVQIEPGGFDLKKVKLSSSLNYLNLILK